MKRIKIQRGYLAQNPYKRAKFYDQGFENVRNPPRTPHLQTYGKKYDLMKLLQVVTALMQLRKNEVNNSPAVQFKEGIKRNMERIKPAIASGAAEQYYLGKPALDAIYEKTMEEINQMIQERAQNMKNLTEEQREDFSKDPRYVKYKEFIKDIITNPIRSNNSVALEKLASKYAKDLADMRENIIRSLPKPDGQDNEDLRHFVEDDFAKIFSLRNFLRGINGEDQIPMVHFRSIMNNRLMMNPSNISTAKAVTETARRRVALNNDTIAKEVFYDPEIAGRKLKETLDGEQTKFESDFEEARKKGEEELARLYHNHKQLTGVVPTPFSTNVGSMNPNLELNVASIQPPPPLPPPFYYSIDFNN